MNKGMTSSGFRTTKHQSQTRSMQLDDIPALNTRNGLQDRTHGSRPMTQSNARLERDKATLRNETFRKNIDFVLQRNQHIFKR